MSIFLYIFAAMNNGVIYIKLPVYVQQFLRQRYCKEGAEGSEPIKLNHELHPAGILLYRKACCLPKPYRVTPLCLSAQLYGLCVLIHRTSPESIPTELQELAKSLPSEKDIKFFAPFAIQPEHTFRSRLVPCGPTTQLNTEDAQQFRAIIFQEFWEDYYSFREEWDSHPEMRGGAKLEEQSAIIEYMIRRDIDLDHEDALVRAIRRRKHNNKVSIECRINKYK